MWKYESPIGPLYIDYLPSEKRYGLFYRNVCWESCATPDDEADNVYNHCTGCYEWDSLDGLVPDCPSDLSEWEEC